jgi:3-hydroxy-9,10-secoandrosta-1,3,5(10)-triene-9,17-dione monooxygenase reductase component
VTLTDTTADRRPDATPETWTLRHLMRRVAQPVVVVTGRDLDGGLWGMTVSTFTSVSLDPPLALFCPSRTSATWAAIGPLGHFVVNVLAAEQDDVASLFARPGPGFPARVPYRLTRDGLPVLTGSVATAHCTVTAVHPGGDHDIVLARVGEVCLIGGGPALTYWDGVYASAHDLSETSWPA